MTQLGRYASVAKQKMAFYQIVQDSTLSLPAAAKGAGNLESYAVDTHVFIATEENSEQTQKLLDVGEQTCYLHAACCSVIKARVLTAKS